LNYRAFINKKWFEVYRVDNYHGYLHEQKFWRSPKPIPLDLKWIPLKMIVDKYIEDIIQNFKKYRGYFKNESQRNH
jgi:hypothetical protein